MGSSIKQRKEQYQLSRNTIDQVSHICVEALQEAEADRKDIVRLRLSLEDILGLWMEKLGEETKCVCKTGTRFGKQYFEIRVKGEKLDPQSEEYGEVGAMIYSKLLAQAGLSLVYEYKSGENCLTIYPPKKSHISQGTILVGAIILAVVLGIVTMQLPKGAQEGMQAVASPVFNTMMGALRAIASPMIFLAICCGIIGIGDLNTIGKIGKKVISRMCLESFLVGALTILGVVWFFPVVSGSGGGSSVSGFGEVFQMLLNVVPKDIVTPFSEGNTLQVIFLGGCVGIAVLVLGDMVAVVRSLIEQANEIIRYLMGILAKIMPLLVFLSIYTLTASGMLKNAGGVLKTIVLSMSACVLALLIYGIIVVLRTKVSPVVLAKKLFPTFLVGITTASSSAALVTNMETCEKKLGIPAKITNFAVPLGQVIFKPTSVLNFVIVAMGMAEMFGTEITPNWMIILVIMAGLLGMSAPPIPGGAFTCYSVLFAQLGIPLEAVATAIVADSIMDFALTAATLNCVQMELVLATRALHMLDRDVLVKR